MTAEPVSLFDPPPPPPTDHTAKAKAGADPRWWVAAQEAVVQASRAHPDGFTTDDVWQLLDGLPFATPEPRALGAVIRAARKAGTIRSTAVYRPSTRPECHGRPVRVWTST